MLWAQPCSVPREVHRLEEANEATTAALTKVAGVRSCNFESFRGLKCYEGLGVGTMVGSDVCFPGDDGILIVCRRALHEDMPILPIPCYGEA